MRSDRALDQANHTLDHKYKEKRQEWVSLPYTSGGFEFFQGDAIEYDRYGGRGYKAHDPTNPSFTEAEG